MKKVLNIAWKDLIVTSRDLTALLLILVTPFALTMVMAGAFGGFSRGGGSGLSDIPVIIVNRDAGQFGKLLVQAFQSEELSSLLEPTIVNDDATARTSVDDDKAAAAVIIPANLSESVVPTGVVRGDPSAQVQSLIEVYANPTRPIGAGVVQGIVEQFLSLIAAGSAGGRVSVLQLIKSGLISPEQALSLGPTIGERAGLQAVSARLIAVKSQVIGGRTEGFNWLSYMAPSMAILFLMFTVSNGGRSLLVERDEGTLPRLLATPTSAGQVLGGKVLGTYLIGLAQMGILIASSTLLFRLNWGSPGAVILLVLALVAAATGWGMVLAAYSRSPAQVGQTGWIMTLVFGMVSGNFFNRQALPQILQKASLVTPNAWGLEAFAKLAAGGGVSDVLLPIIVLLAMAALLFSVAVVAFRRQYA